MNTQVGKSIGIALLLAAGLIAALFAMGVFAPAGVEAGVVATPKPTAMLDMTKPGTADVTLTITFQTDDTVNGSPPMDDVVITLTDTAFDRSTIMESNVAVTQDGMPVGKVTADSSKGTITIGQPESGAAEDVLKENVTTTVVVSGLTLNASAGEKAGAITINQSDVSQKIDLTLYDPANELTGVMASLNKTAPSDSGVTMTLGFTPKLTDSVTITLPVAYDVHDGSSTKTGITVTPDTATVSNGTGDDAGDTIVIATANLTANTAVTVTIAGLANPAAEGNHSVKFEQSHLPAQTVMFSVMTPNTKPTISLDPSELTIVEGGTGTVTVTATDADTDDTLGYSAMSDKTDVATVEVTPKGNTVTVTAVSVTVTAVSVGEATITVTVTDDSGDTATATATATFKVTVNPAPVDPSVELSTDNAGSAVEVDIFANAGTAIRGGTDIDVTLEGFGIPSAIDEDDVIIDGGTDAEFYGNPGSVSVSGDKITLSLPTRNSVTGARVENITGDYAITFKSAAGLSNPTSAGDKDVTVSDADADDHELMVTIVQTVSVSSSFVARGGDATVTAKGLRDGRATVYLMDGNDRGVVLGSGTADDGVVEIEIDTSHSDLEAGEDTDGNGLNALRVIDSSNDKVGMEDVLLGIEPTVTLGSDSAKRSATLEISVSDWYHGDIDAVEIGGISADIEDGDVPVGDDQAATFKVTVPEEVLTGEQEVVIFSGANSATATVDIDVIALNVSPGEVVPGQRVTIIGSGFFTSSDVSSITIGSVELDVPDDARSTSAGRVAVTVTVPLDVGDGDKTVKLSVTDDMNTSDDADDQTRGGEGEITIPGPSIELNPAESVPGSFITVSGSGFAAEERVEVSFADELEQVGQADGSGEFSIRLRIPSGAGVGHTNEVAVAVRSSDENVNISATAIHETPGPAIMVPETAQIGSLITISGTNFEPFTTLEVEIGGREATPSPGPETDINGAFEFEARVPRISAGSHTITIVDSSDEVNSVTETVDVVTTPVVSTPADVFGVLGDSLVVVWMYDNATATWSSYAPSNPPELNDLTGVSSGDIVWVNLNESAEFQGATLQAGWSLISLE